MVEVEQRAYTSKRFTLKAGGEGGDGGWDGGARSHRIEAYDHLLVTKDQRLSDFYQNSLIKIDQFEIDKDSELYCIVRYSEATS